MILGNDMNIYSIENKPNNNDSIAKKPEVRNNFSATKKKAIPPIAVREEHRNKLYAINE